MAGLHKPTISFIDKDFFDNSSASQADYKKICQSACLCFQVSHEKIDFCVFDTEQKKYIVFESLDLNKQDGSLHPMARIRGISEEINSLFSQYNWFKYNYQSVHCIFDNSKSTLVPSSLYDITKKEQYLKFNHFVDHTEVVQVDKLESLDILNLYALPEGFADLVQKVFPYGKISHISTVLLESISNHYNAQMLKNRIFLNLRSAGFDIMIWDKKNLRYYNYFPFNNNDDLIYYLLFVLEQLKIIPSSAELMISGKMENEASLPGLLERYVKDVALIDNVDLEGQNVFSSFPPYYYYTLIKANLCE